MYFSAPPTALFGAIFLLAAPAAAAPAAPQLTIRALPHGTDFHILNVCSHAASLAVHVAETTPASAEARRSEALALQMALAQDGHLEEQTPGVVEVTLAIVSVEALIAGGQIPAPGPMHDWFIAQAAGSCARTLEVK
jgi:hypothetical protein